MRAWKKKNPDRNRELKRESDLRHPETKREAHRRWCAANPEKVRAHQAKSHRKHRIKITEYARRWVAANPERARFNRLRSNLLSRGRKYGLTTAPSREELQALFESYLGLCVHCSEPATECDHVVAYASGGTNDIGNLAPACERCNNSKANKPLIVWLAERRAA